MYTRPEHYGACAIAPAAVFLGDGEARAREKTWTLFDDATTKPVGAWGDVRAACEKGRLQPCVLFYRKTTRGEV